MPPLSRAQDWKAAARGLAGAVLNILYPPRCPGCRRPDTTAAPDGSRLCRTCDDRLDLIVPPFCGRCGETFAGNVGARDSFACGNCAGRSFAFDFAIASCESSGLARELIHRFKYQREFYLRTVLGRLLGPALEDPRIRAADGWILIPVPLHPRRRREREFNQAAEIARCAGRFSGLPVADVLKRTRYTTQQAHLDRGERLTNLRGAFVLHPDPHKRETLAGRNLLLVDDVFTTGTTVNECARVLRKALNPPRLAVATVARG